MPFFVYIIYSPGLQRFYTGTTDDVTKRIEEHNSDKYRGSFRSSPNIRAPMLGVKILWPQVPIVRDVRVQPRYIGPPGALQLEICEILAISFGLHLLLGIFWTSRS